MDIKYVFATYSLWLNADNYFKIIATVKGPKITYANMLELRRGLNLKAIFEISIIGHFSHLRHAFSEYIEHKVKWCTVGSGSI